MTDEHMSDESWHELGRQFQALGKSLAAAFRTAWESEESRQHVEGMKAGLEALVDEVGQAIREAGVSPEAQKVREEVQRAADSARTAGGKALQDARPYLISALQQVNTELQKVIARMEQQGPGT